MKSRRGQEEMFKQSRNSQNSIHQPPPHLPGGYRGIPKLPSHMKKILRYLKPSRWGCMSSPNLKGTPPCYELRTTLSDLEELIVILAASRSPVNPCSVFFFSLSFCLTTCDSVFCVHLCLFYEDYFQCDKYYSHLYTYGLCLVLKMHQCRTGTDGKEEHDVLL